jgi:hypothetical protein
MLAIAVVCYLVVGTAFMAWFLLDCYRAKTRIDNGDGTTSDRRVMTLFKPHVLAGYCLFLLTAWWVAAILYLRAGPDNQEEDPQDRVPPEYR